MGSHRCGRGRRGNVDLEVGNLEEGGAAQDWALLKYLTRLLFVTLLVSSGLVLVLSILLLSRCRGRVRWVEDLVESSHGQCSPLPFPAYLACVVVVIAVFGFGCVGRKVSGLLLIAVSLVAMVVAVVVVVTEQCQDDVRSVRLALIARLGQCRLYRPPPSASSSSSFVAPSSSSSSSANNSVSANFVINTSVSRTKSNGNGGGVGGQDSRGRRFEYLFDAEPVMENCKVTASSVSALCQPNLTYSFMVDPTTTAVNGSRSARTGSPELLMNQTGVEACAKQVASSVYSLCMEDTEIVFPILLTLPLFYLGIGVALVYIKHADLKAKAKAGFNGWSIRTRCSVGTNTTYRTCDSREGKVSGRQKLSRCLSCLCASHSLCFMCLVRGTPCSPCCNSTPSPSTLSFQMREVKNVCTLENKAEGEEGEGEVSLRMLRSSSPSELDEDLHLMDNCI